MPVGIQKTHKFSDRFELIYEYSKFEDLYIVIDIIGNDDIKIITAILKNVNRREH